MPMWWLVGIEQVVWLPIGLLAFLKYVEGRRMIPAVPRYAWYAVVLVLFQCISVFFVDEAYRLVTFARGIWAYTAALLWLIMISAVVTNHEQLHGFLKSLAAGMVCTGILGIIGILGVWRPEFTSPLGYFLPESIRATSYGAAVATRSLGNIGWFVGVGEYFRVSSIFTFATMYAIALVGTIPIVLWLALVSVTRAEKAMWLVASALLVLNLLFTTGRASLLSLLFGGVIVVVIRHRQAAMPLVVIFGCIIGILLVQAEIRTGLASLFEAVALARGDGSVIDRTGVYVATLAGIPERLWFGWGTERDVLGLVYPAGSHSYYLGIIYKHGIFALLSLCLFFCSIGKLFFSEIDVADENRRRVASFGLWILITVGVNGITDVIDLDAITVVLVWAGLGSFASAVFQRSIRVSSQ